MRAFDASFWDASSSRPRFDKRHRGSRLRLGIPTALHMQTICDRSLCGYCNPPCIRMRQSLGKRYRDRRLRADRRTDRALLRLTPRAPCRELKLSWYQVSSDDRMIAPENEQRMMTRMGAKKIITLAASHASLASKPVEVCALIDEAAKAAVD